MKNIQDEKIIRRSSHSVEINIYRSRENQSFIPVTRELMDYIRIWYLIVSMALLAGVLVIAYTDTNTFVRFYVGDMLIVILLYAIIRTVIPYVGRWWLVFGIFVFASLVEFLQMIEIVSKLGLDDIEWIQTWFGSVGDWKDLVCYAVGCMVCLIMEFLNRRHEER